MLTLVGLALAVFALDGAWRLVAVATGAVLDLTQNVLYVKWSRRRRAAVGVETLVGANATVVVACRPDGQVRVRGERWRAHCGEGAAEGETVVVERVDGLTLVVRPPSPARR